MSGTVPGKPGILLVTSTVLHPTFLDPLDFVDWYENTHIQEVQSTGGISGTQRYESLSFQNRYRDKSGKPTAENQNLAYDFLTVYNMPDLAFRESEAFRGLDGQSRPNEELLEKLFKQSAFITRFCEEFEPSQKSIQDENATSFMLSVGVHSNDSADNVLARLAKITGYRQTRHFKLQEASLLSEFNRSYEDEPSDLALLDFDDRSALDAAEKELQGTEGLELGFWHLRRDYKGSERTPAGWKPK
jgi:hypothetical protein